MKQGVFAKTAIATVLAGTALAAQSLGLGEINVASNLNQRFQAVIPLSEISAEDLESVKVSIAPNEEFDRAGIERGEYLTSLRFAIKSDGGHPRIVVTSAQIAREPVVNLLVQARWRGGKIMREYTVLLDPPALPAPAPPVMVAAPTRPALPPPITMGPKLAPAASTPAPIVAPVSKPVPAPDVPPPPPPESEFFETSTEARAAARSSAPRSPRLPAAKPLPMASGSTGSYGPVKPQETLWRVATNTRPSSTISMDQMMLALVEANPGIIIKGITLTAGSMLRVPSLVEILNYSPRAAKERLAAIQSGRAAPNALASAAPLVKAPPSTAPAVKTAIPAPASPPAGKLPPVSVSPIAPVVPPPATKSAVVPPPTATAAVPVTHAPDATSPAPAPVPEPTAPITKATEPEVAVKPAAEPENPKPVAVAPKPPIQPAPPASAVPGLASSWTLLAGAAAAVLLAVLGIRRMRKVREPEVPRPVLTVAPPPKPPAPRSAATVSPPSPMRAGDTSVRTARELAEDHTPFSSSSATGLATDFVIDADLDNTPPPSVTRESRPGFEQVKPQPAPAALPDNDPLADADFHLAYGLHDEAISVLSAGIRRFPARSDLKLKLAETYFAAGNSREFLAVAETLKDKLPAGDWGKLSIMGSQLVPGAALFKSSNLASEPTDFDMGFEEPTPAKPAGSVDFVLKPPAAPNAMTIVPPPLPVTPPAAAAPLPSMPQSKAPASPPPFVVVPPQESDDIDFMLGQSIVPLGMNTLAPVFKTKDAPSPEFNLGATSLNVEAPPSDSELPSLDNDLEISLQSLQVSLTPREVAPASEDELNTKLDLARAYVEMGDHDSARGLLKEVQDEGGEQHRKEAEALMQRLPA